MATLSLEDRLRQAAKSSDMEGELEELAEELEKQQAGLESVRTILEFMEQHPQLELGSPGLLVHFVERFYRHGYEDELLKSIVRRPTMHTVWMLHRVINGTKGGAARRKLWDALAAAGRHPLADDDTKAHVTFFLENR
jgi:hypothetical protein